MGIGTSISTLPILGPIADLLDIGQLEDIRQDFRFGYIIELLDSRSTDTGLAVLSEGIPPQHVFTINPERYTLTEPFQLTLTPTEDDRVIAEENGSIVRELTVEGTFGLKEKVASGFQGSQGVASGNSHFLHLRRLFREYSKLKKNPDDAPFIRMVFHSLRENDHFVVVPRSFTTPRDAATRAHYRYSISMAVIADYEKDPAGRGDFLTKYEDALYDIGQAFTDARTFFVQLNAQVNEINQRVRGYETVLNQAAQAINAMGSFLRTVDGFIPSVYNGFLQSVENLERAGLDLEAAIEDFDFSDSPLSASVRENRKLEAALSKAMMYRSKFVDSTQAFTAGLSYQGENALTESDIEDQKAGATVGSRARIQGGTNSFNGLDLSAVNGVREKIINRGDTLSSLAALGRTTPETIALINNLKAPYVAPAASPGVLGPGDKVLLPLIGAESSTAIEPNNDYSTTEEVLYGTDIALEQDRVAQGVLDIAMNKNGDGADSVSGIQNVVQGTAITLNTERGTTLHVPSVGIRRTPGMRGLRGSALFAAIAIREGILVDPRVEGIRESAVVLDGDVLQQEITPILRGGRPGTSLVVPFGKTSGGGA